MRKKLLIKLFIPFVLLVFLSIAIIGLSSKNPSQTSQSGWTLQTNLQTLLHGRTVNDMTFIDSLTGFAVTNGLSETDTCFIFKTSNGGDNWFVNYRTNEQWANSFRKIKFVTNEIGYICGGGGIALICKTTDGGNTWTKVNYTFTLSFSGMSCLNKDTLFVVGDETLTGGVFRTTNGGQNWQQIYAAGMYNPADIYMFNARIGFYHDIGWNLFKTSEGGFNWTHIGDTGFYYMKFLDSIEGYRITDNHHYLQKTSNGGLNWVSQNLPNIPGGYMAKEILQFTLIGSNEIFGVGDYVWYPNPDRTRGVIFKTTNGGLNWGYQLPDTHLIQIPVYNFIKNIGAKNLWAYTDSGKGIHTIIGGDTTFYTGINTQSQILKDFKLYQNYPNPFNSMTNVKVQMLKQGFAEIKIFDLTGRLIKTLISQKLNSGEHNFKFDASDLSSGVYFYSLFVNGMRVDTKKLMLIK